jgi:hypothetical protein
LTPREISLLSSWEERRIPLRVVLEGINACFNDLRLRKKKGKSKTSLSVCESYVLKSHEMFKDRQVGGHEKRKARERQKRQIEKETSRFLSEITPELRYLEPPFSQAVEILRYGGNEDDILDELEASVEELIFRHASEEDREKVKNLIKTEHALVKGEELERFTRLQLIRLIRTKHKIPHLSFFYY